MSDVGQKFSALYEVSVKANPSEYIMISAGGKAGADKNRGDGGSTDGGRGCGSGSVSVWYELRDSNDHARLCSL